MKIAALACMLLISCGCYGPRLGPTYTIDGVYTDGREIQIAMQRTSWHRWIWALSPSVVEKSTLVATLPIPQADQSVSTFASIRKIDSTGDRASYYPVCANGAWVRFVSPTQPKLVSLIDGKLNHRLVTVAYGGSHDLYAQDGLALSPTGRYLLLAKADCTTVLDTADHGKVLLHETNSTLQEILRVLLFYRHQAGKWFITDDLRYVVVLPAPYTFYEVGDPIGDALNHATIRGCAVDLQRRAIICDRRINQIFTAPSADEFDEF